MHTLREQRPARACPSAGAWLRAKWQKNNRPGTHCRDGSWLFVRSEGKHPPLRGSAARLYSACPASLARSRPVTSLTGTLNAMPRSPVRANASLQMAFMMDCFWAAAEVHAVQDEEIIEFGVSAGEDAT